MFKRYLKRAILVVLIVAAVAFSVASGSTQAGAPSAPTVFYQCVPSVVGAFTDRVHVFCATPYNGTISWFAYCTADSATASRLLSVFTTAKATGKDVGLYFDPNNTSGTACGCAASNCRLVTGAEVRP